MPMIIVSVTFPACRKCPQVVNGSVDTTVVRVYAARAANASFGSIG